MGLIVVFSPQLLILSSIIILISSIWIYILRKKNKDALFPSLLLVISVPLALFTLYLTITLYAGFN